MKRSILCHLTLLIGAVAGAQSAGQTNPSAPPRPVVRIHFAGLDQAKQNGGGTTFQDIWKLPETAAFVQNTLDKLNRFISAQFPVPNDASEKLAEDLIRPLLADILLRPTYFECADSADDSLDWRLAIHLTEARAGFWATNCATLIRRAEEAQDEQTPPFEFTRSGAWFVVTAQSNASQPLAQRLEREGPPGPEFGENWLSIDADLSKLKKRWVKGIPSNAAKFTATIRGRESNLKTDAKLQFSEAIPWQMETWRIPVNLISDPNNTLMSFTAARGIARALNRFSASLRLPQNSAPNQLFAWGNSSAPFQIQAAVPVADSADFIERIAEDHMPEWNKILTRNSVGKLERSADTERILWRSLPVLTPYLRGTEDSGQDYVLGGVFEISSSPNPPPAALIRQLTDGKDIVFYEWEITQARLFQLRSMIPYVSLVTTLPTLKPNSAASAWLNAVAPKLGNTVTEISVSAPDTISLSRTSHFGLNGLELLALAYWLESPEFPQMKIDIGFLPVPTPTQP